MQTGIDPKVDYAFKRVFAGSECQDILPNLLNAVLMRSGAERLTKIEVLNPFSQKETAQDKQIILDVKARDEKGHEFLIEMQMVAQPYFPERLLFYLAKDYSQQMVEGDDWDVLRPVIVICFINDVLCPQATGYHGLYEMLDQTTKVRFSDHWQLHLFELPKFQKSAEELTTDIERWTYFLQHGNELDPAALPTALQIPEVRLATEVLRNMSLNALERHQYEARQRFLRDQATSLAYAEKSGIEKGIVIGSVLVTRESVIEIGTLRLGPPPAHILTQLEGINSVAQLKALRDRTLDCSTWDSLFDGSQE